ncbi:MAG: hypothetical protein PVH41_02410 [Anaerolineae bacterium]
MKASSFTPQQRRVVLLMVLLVAVVLALLSGFLITSLQTFERASPAATLPPDFTGDGAPSPTPLPAATPTPAATPVPEEGIWSQVRAARLFDQIAHQVETKRELAARAEVPLSFMHRAEMAEALGGIYAERDLEAEWLPYVLLGLLHAEPVPAQAQASAGIYLPEQEQLIVSFERPQGDSSAQAVLAHAYAHALQDQHFDLEAMALRAQTIDGALALRALVEGDATLLTALYSYPSLASVDWERLVTMIIEAETPGYDPPDETRSHLQRFPHHQGREFAEVLFEAGGWEAVNRAYVDPPRSTEQVLHPTRYLGGGGAEDAGGGGGAAPRDEPTDIVVPDVGAALGDDWQKVADETMGEFVVGLYLGDTLPETRARQVAEGWDGDTFAAWVHGDGRRVLVWRSIWDTAGEAAEYEGGLLALVPQRYYPVRPVDAPRRLPGAWWETPEGAVQVYRAGRYVLLVLAPDLNTLENLSAVLP